MTTELTVQSEKAFQKVCMIFTNRDVQDSLNNSRIVQSGKDLRMKKRLIYEHQFMETGENYLKDMLD